ncbi:divergent protein kinase domain 2A-like [Branchiostoma lanceolatum]|uniref:divergent protein kinase domain 2A-like n=1 Tax=Branchiostoma lanceolatum TaxID=7740 RepID=UPI00345695D9
MDLTKKAPAKRLCRKFQYPGTRVLFFLITSLSLGFLVGAFWQIKDELDPKKRHLDNWDTKYAQRKFHLHPFKQKVREGLGQLEEEVHGISKEHGYTLVKEATPKTNVAEERHEQQLTLKRLTATEKCPACFGESLCRQVDAGAITVDVANKKLEHKGVYFGLFKDTNIVAKRLAGSFEWVKFDEFICQNASVPGNCDVSKMISKTTLVADDALQLSWLREAWRIAHTDGQIALESCMTDKLIEELKKAYGQNVNGQLGKTEQAYMITSLLMNPEATVLTYFTTRSERKWPFPKYLGACGRVIFVENGGKLLDSSLASTWKDRANIALQLLNMIDTFRNGDPEWIVIFLDFRYENFAIDQYGRLNLIDFDEVMLIDREESGDGEKKESCNMEDLKTFVSEIDKDDFCFQVPQYSQMMYALACVRLLSFLPEHLLKSLSDRHRSPEHVRPPGLLWGPPEHEATAIEALLRGCAEEKVAGGRLEAIEKLKAVLQRTLIL